ncbi:hypothetical protein DPMN_057599 [Dreissena polymorpha]|uniref:Uncharacterized protein n=1 Tax=Dreissena polymorpha TaxID=45954 RepID=A0A9D4C096_DREPO|nr:hypothetical protein DPMN_057599 [Dreissena polymorpha]
MSSVRMLVVLMVVCILAGSLVQQTEAQCRCAWFRCRRGSECYVGKCGWIKKRCCSNDSDECRQG